MLLFIIYLRNYRATNYVALLLILFIFENLLIIHDFNYYIPILGIFWISLAGIHCNRHWSDGGYVGAFLGSA